MPDVLPARAQADEPQRADEVSFERTASGRHVRPTLPQHPATGVSAALVAASVAMAGFAAYGSASGPDTETARASVNEGAPLLADSAVVGLRDGALSDVGEGTARADRAVLNLSAAQAAQDAGAKGSQAASKQAEKKDEAAQRARAKEAAAAKRAEEAAAAERAEEAAAAERAEEAAAAERESQAASRSSERETAPPQREAASAPAPSGDPRSIARSMLGSYGWSGEQFGCLDSLWAKESGWNPSANNPSSGAYGIPQSLPGSKMAAAGSDWQTNPATQIEWGLGYIESVYGSPCAAWSHSQANNWY
ncbi:MAG TPA: hypothetical protein VJ976_12125 [Ornithinimicrobium sp.]|uniref:aggregation-promoting factor C-terminal-like domain-containing protein n=1 Tax=Ornithinimicrobium sp. TaxID=1977084 RepID=UPI002B46CB7C|nr:hypothetical protein [Ornithinimicrobium sp.]HKJ13121.1 hypothetical protein [Ornithinimicrobium sp.]